MKHELVYSEHYKDRNGNPVLRGVKIPPNLLTTGYEWREIKSARKIESDYSSTHVFRKFRLRLTRTLSLVLSDTRCLPAGFGSGGMVFGKETTIARLDRVEHINGENRYNRFDLFDGTKDGSVKFYPNPDKVWAVVTKVQPIKKSELKKVKIVGDK